MRALETSVPLLFSEFKYNLNGFRQDGELTIIQLFYILNTKAQHNSVSCGKSMQIGHI